MGKVIYLTGAPSTGKSTLCQLAAQLNGNTKVISYSTLLRDYISSTHGIQLSAQDIREKSAAVVTRNDIDEVDRKLIQEVKELRGIRNIIIDSHPVTMESYGFRIAPFSIEQLQQLSLDVIICLYSNPSILRNRINANPEGRSLPTDFDLTTSIYLHSTIAAQYALATNAKTHLIECNASIDDLVSSFMTLTGLDRPL